MLPSRNSRESKAVRTALGHCLRPTSFKNPGLESVAVIAIFPHTNTIITDKTHSKYMPHTKNRENAVAVQGRCIPSDSDRIGMVRIVMAVSNAIIVSSGGIVRKVQHESAHDQPKAVVNNNNPDLSDVLETKREEAETIGAEVVYEEATAYLKTQEAIKTRHQQRLHKVLNEDLFPMVAASLLIRDEDHHLIQNAAGTHLKLPSDAFGCVVLLLSNIILLSSEQGYDARVRNVLKTACVHVLYKNMEPHTEASTSQDIHEGVEEKATMAEAAQQQSHAMFVCARKFEAIEKQIATIVIGVLLNDKPAPIEGTHENSGSSAESASTPANATKTSYSRKDVLRGLKIGTAGIAAGTLFAVTGGMAAPGIAAGLAALGIAGGSAAIAISVLTSATTLATLLGVGGGGLAAYKMKLRTDGLSEFRIKRENVVSPDTTTNSDANTKNETCASSAELHTTVCISGWLQDECDFQRPWGIHITDPPNTNKLDALQRFYAVHNPEKVEQCAGLLNKFDNNEDRMYSVLRTKYGRDPDHLFPLHPDPNSGSQLDSHEESFISEFMKNVLLTKTHTKNLNALKSATEENGESVSSLGQNASSNLESDANFSASGKLLKAYSGPVISCDKLVISSNPQLPSRPDNRSSITVWDWHNLYGGDLYTVTWETERLLKFCDLAEAMIQEIKTKATKQVLKQTILAGLLSAIVLPSYVLSAASVIDDPYQMMILRSDEGGVELARSLLVSGEKRPVTLVGFSFGARTIFSCLLELSRHQDLWEEEQVKGNQVLKAKGGLLQDILGEEDDTDKIVYTREPASIVEDVVIMGMPRFIGLKDWAECRRLISGRLINCYSRKDWFLSIMFQYKSMTGVLRPTCGTCPVEGIEGVENYDVSEIATSHGKYCSTIAEILRVTNFGNPNPLQVISQ